MKRLVSFFGFAAELVPLLRPHRGLVLVSLLSMGLLAVAQAGYAALTGPVLRSLFGIDVKAGAGPLRWLFDRMPEIAATPMWIPAAIVLVATVKGVAQAVQFVVNGRIAQRTTRALRERAFARLLVTTPAFLQRHNTADLMTRLSTDAERIESSLFYGLMPIVRESLALLGLLGYCISLDPKLSFFAFLVIPVSALPLVRFSKKLKRVAQRSQSQVSAMSHVVHETLLGLRTVQAFVLEERQRDRFVAANEQHARAMAGSYLVRGVRSPVMEVLGSIGTAALVYWLTTRVSSGAVDAAHVASFASAVLLMYDPVKKLGQVGDHLAQGSVAFARLREVIDAPLRDGHVDDSIRKKNIVSVDGSVPALSAKGLSLSYPDGTQALKNVSLNVPQGSSLALVGPSGAGKSTFVHLLLRFLDPSSGVLEVMGQKTTDVPHSLLREQISWVSQDVFLFDASVRDNLTLGRDYPADAIDKALRSAGASEFVSRLPQGLETLLGERATRLSGGERQRLAIARAFLRDSPLLLLDEPTSALDARSEQLVQQALALLMRGRTTLIIAHRLATVQRVDQIAVLDRGELVERGTHDELVARGGLYGELAKLQLLHGVFEEPA